MNEDTNIREAVGPLKSLRLSESDKKRMRNELHAYVSEHPIRERSPYFASVFSVRHTVIRTMAFAMSLVLVLGVGTSYASESALPGDFLYPVKISVVENVRGALAVSSEAKASWNTERVERRLEEAETLAARGALTAEAKASIESQLDASIEEFEYATANIENQEDGVLAVAEIRSNLEASLIGHGQVLAMIRDSVPTSREHLEPIIEKVQERTARIALARATAELSIVPRTDDRVRVAAASRKDTANRAIRDTDTSRTKAAPAPNADASLMMAMEAPSRTRAEEIADEGEAEYESGRYGEAFGSFQAAIREAISTAVHREAESRLSFTTDAPIISAMMLSATPTSTATTTDEAEVEVEVEDD